MASDVKGLPVGAQAARPRRRRGAIPSRSSRCEAVIFGLGGGIDLVIHRCERHRVSRRLESMDPIGNQLCASLAQRGLVSGAW
jgi:hypothetical protein